MAIHRPEPRYDAAQMQQWAERDAYHEALTTRQQELKFFQTAKKMRSVGVFFLVLGGLFALTAMAVSYIFHGTSLVTERRELFLPIVIPSVGLGAASFILGIYLRKKSYWKDPEYLNEKIGDYSNNEGIKRLFTLDLAHFKEAVINKYMIKTELIKWSNANFDRNNPKTFLPLFIAEFGWQPLDFEILKIDDNVLSTVPLGNILRTSYNSFDSEFEKRKYEQHLKRYGIL